MTIEDVIRERSITELVHFTTNHGLTGILASGAVKARKRLSRNQYLEHIYLENCPDRSKDVLWHDYVNLSITDINQRLFAPSEAKWHPNLEGWWCILSLRPELLCHPGVTFCTTNNMYTGVSRATGVDGLNALFAPRITQWWSSSVTRPTDLHPSKPTCMQAEALYPKEIPIGYLQRIYVRDHEHVDDIYGTCGALGITPVEITVDASRFD